MKFIHRALRFPVSTCWDHRRLYSNLWSWATPHPWSWAWRESTAFSNVRDFPLSTRWLWRWDTQLGYIQARYHRKQNSGPLIWAILVHVQDTGWTIQHLAIATSTAGRRDHSLFFIDMKGGLYAGVRIDHLQVGGGMKPWTYNQKNESTRWTYWLKYYVQRKEVVCGLLRIFFQWAPTTVGLLAGLVLL